MQCPVCGGQGLKYGRNRNSSQRFLCRQCRLTFSEQREQEPRIFADRQLTLDKATKAIRLLMEGVAVRSVCRLLQIGKHTVLELLLRVGRGCERLMERTILHIPCRSIQCDELWSFVFCKERTKERNGYHHEEIGDCYTWTALERDTKLMLAYAVGKRDNATARQFVRNLRRATTDSFQIDTDGLSLYQSVIPLEFGPYQNHAKVIKIFGAPVEGEARYSPAQIIDLHVEVGSGWPNLDEASTSFVERSNLTIRTMLKRFARLTLGHSKCWDHHEASLGLLFAVYNFVRPHMTLNKRERRKTTPAMAAGITDHVWSVRELIERAIPQDEAAIAS